MKPAPPFNCCYCQRRIGKTRLHWLFEDQRVSCSKCVDARDLYGETHRMGSRAAIANLLGLWP